MGRCDGNWESVRPPFGGLDHNFRIPPALAIAAPRPQTVPVRQPVAFLAHGAPTLATEGGAWGQSLSAFGSETRPGTVLVISAHWETPGAPRITAAPVPGVIHDFGGFPEELDRLDYPAPGDPLMAARLAKILAADLDPRRALDHGAWVPLRWMFPNAALPVLQLSLPFPRNPQALLRLGERLRPFRDEGVLILGSGGLVHNLRRLDWTGGNAPEAWATGFEAWVLACLEAGRTDRLAAELATAPGFASSVPTSEHFDPLWVALGALWPEERPRTLFEGWQLGDLSLRCLAWG